MSGRSGLLVARPPGRRKRSPPALAIVASLAWAVSGASEPQTSPSGNGTALSTVGVFGPQRYVRTTGPRNVYTTTVAIPPWVVAPFAMHVVNGEADGSFRVSSATIAVNGATVVAAPADFNQNVPALDRAVTLTPTTTLTVTLTSKPTSYLSIAFSGTNGDHTAPAVTIAAPAPGATLNDPAPKLLLRYRDAVGAGEPAASGVDTATLRVLVDGVDRTSLFTRRSEEASAAWPADQPLADGPHNLVASIRDVAGNTGQAEASFRVDTQAPTIQVADPSAGAFLATRTPALRIRYADETALDLATLRVDLNGTDRTSLFTIGPSEAVAALDDAHALGTGANQLSARIRDRGGSEATASVSFNVDVQAPVVQVVQPTAGARLGSADVELTVHYADDQALDVGTFVAAVDGQPVALVLAADGATGRVTLAEGSHDARVEIRDRAGNLSSASAAFTVDTTVPEIHVVQPVAGALLATATPQVRVTFGDQQGVDLGTLRITIDGVDRTSLFTVGSDDAVATVPLPDGTVSVVAEVADLTGNRASARSSFTIDTVAPTLTFDAPADRVNTAHPAVRLRYADVGTGVGPGSVQVFVDDVDRTALFAVGPDAATAILDPALPDGRHEVQVRLADRAGNPGRFSAAFTVDTTPPQGRFLSPLNDAFLNEPAPVLRLAWTDGDGTGVEPSSLRLSLRAGDGPEVDVTGYMQAGPAGAEGRVPLTAPLVDGVYRLHADFTDRAGNAAAAESAFEVDTVKPTFRIEAPAAGAHVPTRTPSIAIVFADDRSGIDVAALRLLVDGLDRSELLVVADGRATAALTESLAEGAHHLAVTVADRAGNRADAPDHVFTVDTIAPTASVAAPAPGALVGRAAVAVQVTYADEGPDGVDPTSVRVAVDGVDQTAAFAVGAAQATGTVALGDGPHRLEATVLDWAGNATVAAGLFGVDTAAPAVSLSAPADGSYHRTSPVTVTGTVRDADPDVAVECRRGAASSVATVTPAEGEPGVVLERAFSCALTLKEGANAVAVVATDRFHLQGEASLALNLDTAAPRLAITRPLDGDYTAAAEVEVTGSIEDASPVSVDVAGVSAPVEGGGFRASVPLADVADVTLRVVATDAAGNTSEAAVTVHVDRIPPAVRITRPAAGAYLKGPSIDVEGVVVDASPVFVEINGEPATAAAGGFTARVSAPDGALTLRVVARDAAGNVASAERDVHVDSTPPSIEVDSPAEAFITNQAGVRVTGRITDASPATLTLDGAPVALDDGSFSMDVTLGPEGLRTIVLAATDAAGNAITREVHGIVDRTPPLVTVVGPTPDGVVGAVPALVQGTVEDATPVSVTVDGVAAARTDRAWQASVDGLGEGPHRFEIAAVDAAGNRAQVSRDVIVDLAPPVVTITSPADGALTRDDTIEVAGSVVDGTAGTLSVNGGAPAATSPGTSPFAVTVPLAEGDTRIEVTATDSAHRSTVAAITVTRDSTPPVVDLSVPERISRGRGGSAIASATDAIGVAQVRLLVGADVLAMFTSAPYRADLTVPPAVNAGATLVVTAEATDRAGNVSRASRSVRVVSDGALVGQVLDDVTGLPLAGARVHMRSSSGGRATTTDERGRYSVPASDLTATLEIDKDGMSRVVRETAVASGTGTLPVDARLTALAAPVVIGPDGGTLSAGEVSVPVPAGALAAPVTFRLTRLSAQGLPRLLPLGWSPLVAFDLRVEAGPALSPLTATVTGLAAGVVTIVTTNETTMWSVLAPGLTAADGAVSFELPGPGEYAVVVADDPDIAIGAEGEPLTGVDPVPLPETAHSTGPVVPAQVPPAGGTAVGELALESPVPLTSGTVIQAEITETYQLSSSEIASDEKRVEDVVLFRQPRPPTAALAARVPITPSRTFSADELVGGNVHLEFVSGREDVRGQTGGSEPVSLDAGPVRLSVAGGSLAEDTAIALEAPALSSFLPSGDGLSPLAEAVVDLSGSVVGIPAELSVASDVVNPDDVVLLCRVVRLDGVPRLTVVATAALEGGRLVPHPLPGLPGIVEGGRYVWYRTSAVGFVMGTTLSSAGPVGALATGAGLPFVALSRADGHFVLPVLAGPTVSLDAVAPHTSLHATGSATVSAGESTAVDLMLAGAVSTATVTPADGAVAQSVTVQVDIASAAPLDPATVTVQNVKLLRGDPAEGHAVPVRLVLAASGRRLSVVPEAALEFSTPYTLQAGGLTDRTATAVIVPVTTFTTRADTPPVYDLTRLTFSFPDENGLVHLTAPLGSLPPGMQVLVLDASNGNVLTTTAGNDGSLTSDIPATINDRLLVTITDPQGNVTTFQRSQFVAEDGRVAVGPGGGLVEGEGGIQMRIPDGALDRGVVLKIEPFGADRFPPEQQPDLPDGHFASGITIHSDDMPTYKKEVRLAFPVPDGLPPNPDDVLFFVYRRLEGPEGRVAFETIDYATIEGTGADAKVAMASPLFPSILDSLGTFDLSGNTGPVAATHYFLLWHMKELFPGGPTPGVVSGKLLRPKFDASSRVPTMQPVAGGLVSGTDDHGDPLYKQLGTMATVAVSQPDGRYTLWDPSFTGGTVQLIATAPGPTPSSLPEARRATAYELFGSPDSPFSPLALEIRSLFSRYPHVAHADITFSAALPAANPSALNVRVFRNTSSGRVDAGGIVTVNTPLLIGYKGQEVTLRGSTVQFGQNAPEGLATIEDPLRSAPSVGMDRITDSEFVPGVPGMYTFSGTASTDFGTEVTATATIRVVAAGGKNDTPIEGQPPGVITFATVPKAGAIGIPVAVFPQVTFTEPVKNVPGHVTLASSAGPVPVRLIGVAPSGGIIDDLVDAGAAVTAITLQPARALDYGTVYHLKLTADIVDLDTTGGAGTPNPLAPFDLEFKTFDPGLLEINDNGNDLFGSAGIAISSPDASRTYAYLAQNNQYDGTLRIFDVTEPGAMQEVAPDPGAENFVWGRPADIAAAGNRVAIATNPTNLMRPSNLYVFDVTFPEKPAWVGAVSLSTNSGDGWIRRLAMDDFNVYAANFRKGIQVIDRGKAEALFGPPGPDRAAKVRQFNTPGGEASNAPGVDDQGRPFGWEAITQTIPVLLPAPDYRPARLFDLKVRNYAVGDLPRPFAVAVGEPGAAFVVADTVTGEARTEPAIITAGWRINWAEAVSLGRVRDVEIAAVGGTGQIGLGPQVPMLAIVNMGFPTSPMGLGAVALPHAIGDVVLRDTRVIVTKPGTGTATVVDVSDPSNPVIVGTLSDVSSRIAFDATGILYSTERSISGGNDPHGGLRSTTFEPHPFVRSVDPIPVIVDPNPGYSVSATDPEPLVPALPTLLQFGMAPASYAVTSASLQFYKTLIDGTVTPAGIVPVSISSTGVGTYSVDPGILKATLGQTFSVVLTVTTSNGLTLQTAPRPLPFLRLRLRVDSNNDTKLGDEFTAVDQKDKDALFPASAGGTAGTGGITGVFGFWAATVRDPACEPINEDLTDWATIRVRRSRSLPPGSSLTLRAEGATWFLSRKLGPATEMFSDKDKASAQRNEITTNAKQSSGTGEIIIPAEWLTGADTELLVKFTQPPTQPPPGSTAELKLLYTPRGAPAAIQTDAAQIEVKPIEKWITVYSVRRIGAEEEVSPVAYPVSGWAIIPTDVKRITAIVHGFHVSDNCAKKHFIPEYFRKLYWAGHPVLERQSIDGGKAHAVGISWPGDITPGIPNTLPGSSSLVPLFYPQDEVNAFKAGVPVSKLLRYLHDLPSAPVVDAVVHSLGNIMVNSALSHPLGYQPGMQPPGVAPSPVEPSMAGVVRRYVMNEAALAAEAFSPGYTRNGFEVTRLESALARWGYPDDAVWQQQWQVIRSNSSFLADWLNKLSYLDPNLTPKPEYDRRWTKGKRVLGPSSSPAQGDPSPWRGIFADNLSRTEIFNTYNPNDDVVRIDGGPLGSDSSLGFVHPWLVCQLLFKPNVEGTNIDLPSLLTTLPLPITVPAESPATMYWARLDPTAWTTGDLWSGAAVVPTPDLQAAAIRDWAELAFWFPVTSGPAGAQRLPLLDSTHNISFEDWGRQTPTYPSVDTHTYLDSRPLHDVWGAFVKLKDILK